MDRFRQQELFQEIKEKTDIVSVISEYVSLRKAGRSLLGLCPFHSEKTPSFNVNAEKQFFYCFGCGAGGDVFSFLMKIENLEFIEAAHRLAERAGVLWPDQGAGEKDEEKADLYRINHLAADFFHYCLVKTQLGKRAWEYLRQRGLTEEIRDKFQLGYSPPGWSHLTDLLKKKAISLEAASSIGLLGFGENGYYDRFRDRIIFPIADSQGRIVGFGGRVIGQGEPKYLNSPESALFHKGRFVYGLNLAKESIRNQQRSIIMEGYMDVVQAHQHGFTNTVASLGTSLTREQAKLIKRHAAEAVLAYDADSAGQNATIRGMELLQEAGLKVRILRPPAGEDPDSFLKKQGGPAFAALLEQAASLIEFKIEHVLSQFDVNSPEGKIAALQAVLPELGAIESGVSREYYIRQLVRRIGVSENAILTELQSWLKVNRKNSPLLDRKPNPSYTKTAGNNGPGIAMTAPANLSPLQRAIFTAEKELLGLALQEYDKFERIKEELKADEFHFPIWRDLFIQLKTVQGPNDSTEILAKLTGPQRECASALLAEQELKSRRIDWDEAVEYHRKLRLKERIQQLTERLSTGRNENGQALSEEELKQIVVEFTELKRRLKLDVSAEL